MTQIYVHVHNKGCNARQVVDAVLVKLHYKTADGMSDIRLDQPLLGAEPLGDEAAAEPGLPGNGLEGARADALAGGDGDGGADEIAPGALAPLRLGAARWRQGWIFVSLEHAIP